MKLRHAGLILLGYILGETAFVFSIRKFYPDLFQFSRWLAWGTDGHNGTPGKPQFTVGKETTYVTEPLDKDGFIDYATALNRQLARGITPNSNANVLLWKAIGPHPQGRDVLPEYFWVLGIEVPPVQGDYFVELKHYTPDQFPPGPGGPGGPGGLAGPGGPADSIIEQHEQAKRRPWTPRQFPQLAGWLKANQKPLALAVEASRCPGYFNPIVPPRDGNGSAGLINAPLHAVALSRDIANALTVRAMLHLGEGRFDDAWEDLLACHRLARLIGRGATLIEALVGFAIDSNAGIADVALLDGARLTSKQAKACLRDLQALPLLPVVADKIDLGERFVCLDIVMMLNWHGLDYLDRYSTNPPKGKSETWRKIVLANVDWDPALRNANRWFDRIAATLRVKNRSAREQQINALDQDIRAMAEKVRKKTSLKESLLDVEGSASTWGEKVGDILSSTFLPAFRKMQQAADRGEQAQVNLHLAFALAAYRHDHGVYPKQLSDLAPKYLGEIPDDLYSGMPLIYRPTETGYLLYSVGPNGEDDAGRGYADDPPGDDLPIRIPVPERKRDSLPGPR
jgi:hypothetical protein